MLRNNNPLLDAALEYASRGWFVFPLQPGNKIPLAGSHGFQDATTDQDTIRKWWSETPDANIGIATGQSHLVVVDIDTKNGTPGWESWRDILSTLGRGIDKTLSVETPTGGGHIYYKGNGTQLQNSAGKLGPGLDTRANGGYVVAPPSVHPNGDPYQWAPGYSPEDCELLPIPDGLKRMLAADRISPEPSKAHGAVIQAGTRNVTLTSLAGSMRRKGASEDSITAALLSENARCNPPLDRDEVLRIATSVARYEPSPEEHATDLGNARRLLKLHGIDMRYCERMGGWFCWAGQRWQQDLDGVIDRFAKDVPLSLYAEMATTDDDNLRKELGQRARRAESASAKKAMLEMAWSEPNIPVPPDAFDPDPWLLNCLNGTIDLRTGELHAHDREDLITHLAPVFYDQNATFPLWERFLDTTTNGDKELQHFLQVCAGYSLTGSTAEEKLFFVHGPAGSGKSTFTESLKAVMGDYAKTAAFDSFISNNRTGAPRDDIASLAGARLVTSIEVDKGRKLADSLVKQITGGDTVTARFLYHRQFEFRPQFKLWLVANDAPRATDSDTGLWRRILKVPFEHVIPDAEKDPNVKATLMDVTISGAALLAWAVKGCLEWQRNGLIVPARVKEATEAYRDDNDPLKEFYAECCVFDPQAQVTRASIWSAYQEWAKENGERWPVTNRDLADRLRRKGCKDQMSHGTRLWRGVGLLSEATQDRF